MSRTYTAYDAFLALTGEVMLQWHRAKDETFHAQNDTWGPEWSWDAAMKRLKVAEGTEAAWEVAAERLRALAPPTLSESENLVALQRFRGQVAAQIDAMQHLTDDSPPPYTRPFYLAYLHRAPAYQEVFTALVDLIDTSFVGLDDTTKEPA